MKFKKIVFNNDSSVETIEDSSTKRSNRYEEQLQKQMKYWRQHPEEFVEYTSGINLHWYQKLLIKWKAFNR